MAEGSELQAILAVAEQLREELGAPPVDERRPPTVHDRLEPWVSADVRQAQWVARLSNALVQIAAAAAGQAAEDMDEDTAAQVATALARTELVIRGELMRGDAPALREKLPGFVFLVVLPSAGMDRALELANRTTALLESVRD